MYFVLESIPALPIRRRTVRRRPAGPSPGTLPAVRVRCESAIDALGRLVAVRAAHAAHHVLVLAAGAAHAVAVLAARQRGDDGRELALQDGNALLDDLVGLEVADGLDVDVEVGGLGVVVEGLVGRVGGFPGCVVGDGPGFQH